MLQSARVRGIHVSTMELAGVDAEKIIGSKLWQLTNPKLTERDMARLMEWFDDNAIGLQEAEKHLKAELRRRGSKMRTGMARMQQLKRRVEDWENGQGLTGAE